MRVVDNNNIPRLMQVLRDLGRRRLEIGILSGESDSEILMIAGVHEFGCKIEVTPKMRAWFAYQGYPLKQTTREINIPERSFLRSGFDASLDDIYHQCTRLLDKVIQLELTVDAFFDVLGQYIAGKLQEYMTDLDDQPNSQMTIERKRSANPLIDSGRLRESITYRVVRR